MNKENVIFAPGPLHLFWTTGLYYVWELAKSFNIILIVGGEYKDSSLFQKVVNHTEPAEIIYLSEKEKGFHRHAYYVEKFMGILRKYSPVLLFQHNAAYVQNIYLYNLCKSSGIRCCRIQYQDGMMIFNWREDYRIRENLKVASTKTIHGVPVPSWLARKYIHWRDLKDDFLHYDLYPYLLTGGVFERVINLHTGEFRFHGEALKRAHRARYEHFLAYYSCEIQNLKQMWGHDDGVVQIVHPVQTVGEECHHKLYTPGPDKIISLLPSYGLSSQQISTNENSAERIIDEVSSNWISAIKILSDKFPGTPFVWKLHPVAEREEAMQALSKKILQAFPHIKRVPSSDSAQKWIIESKVVVTDLSTVFWWANLLKHRIVISLNLFGYKGGDEARHYDGVFYFDSLKSLRNADFTFAPHVKEKKAESVVTLTEFAQNAARRSKAPQPE